MQIPPSPVDAGPTWMSVALAALTLLQLVSGVFLTRVLAALDRVTRLSEQHEVKITIQDQEIAALRKRVPHVAANAPHAEQGMTEVMRLLVEELRASRAAREGRAA